jgi:hypothetical protein
VFPQRQGASRVSSVITVRSGSITRSFPRSTSGPLGTGTMVVVSGAFSGGPLFSS